MSEATYICDKAPGFKMRVVVNGKRHELQFVNKMLRIDDDVLIDTLDELLIDQPHLGQLIKKLDRERALKIVEEHKAQMDRRNSVVKGGMTGADLAKARIAQTSANAKVQMKAAGMDDQAIEKAIGGLEKDHGLSFTTQGDTPVSADTTGQKLIEKPVAKNPGFKRPPHGK